MKTLFALEIKRNIKTIIIFTIIAIIVAILYMSLFPMFQEQSETFIEFLKSYPPEMLNTFDISIETFTTSIGLYSLTALYIMLVLGIMSIFLGLKQFGYDKTNKVYEYLFVKPISRKYIYLSKLISGFTMILFSYVLYLMSLMLIMQVIDSTYDKSDFIIINFVILLLMIFLYLFGVTVANILPKIKSIPLFATGITFLFFFINVLAGILELEELNYLTPFGMHSINDILATGFDSKILFLEIILFIIIILVNYILFVKREVRG